MGTAIYELDNFDKAIDYYTRPIIDDCVSTSCGARSLTYQHLGRHSDALTDCDRAPPPISFPMPSSKIAWNHGSKKDTIECQVSAKDVPVRTLLQGFNIRPPVDGADVGRSAAESLTPGKRSPENSVLGSLSLNPTYGTKALTPIDRAKGRRQLFRLLKGLSTAQFDELAFVLELPPVTVPSGSAAGGDRTSALLQWAEGPTGIGLPQLHHILQLVISSAPR